MFISGTKLDEIARMWSKMDLQDSSVTKKNRPFGFFVVDRWIETVEEMKKMRFFDQRRTKSTVGVD
jgi:hypothetical protein